MSLKNKPKKKITAGLIAGAVVFVLYALIFGLGSLPKLLIGVGASALIGWIVSVMAKGLDVSKKAPAQNSIQATGDKKADTMIDVGQQLMHDIRMQKNSIGDEAILRKIDQLDDISDRIFRAVADQPQKAPLIRRSMHYYLPTVRKMLDGYRQIEERQVTGQNAQETKQKISEAMDVVIKAFDHQLDAMYQSDMLDISTDIDVLQALLKQDGLVDNDMTKAAEQAKGASVEAVSSGSAAQAVMKE